MALQKAFDTEQGITANYWRITRVAANYEHQVCDFTISLYHSQAARKNGAAPYNVSRSGQIMGDDFIATFDPGDGATAPTTDEARGVIYQWFKANDELFLDATDV